MSDAVRKVYYFSLSVPDKPGETFKVLAALVSAGVNLLACTGFPRGRRAQIDVVPDDTRKFSAAAKKAGFAFMPKKAGFLIQGEDRPGALASPTRRSTSSQSTGSLRVTAAGARSCGSRRRT
jgi:hypothetical protein